uniref:Uncharacterized protein n=1 Tax=Arundo donax TaxID=35708 RepID=A0A0A8YB17_ARUDO
MCLVQGALSCMLWPCDLPPHVLLAHVFLLPRWIVVLQISL